MRGKRAKSLRRFAGFKPGTTVTYGQQESVKLVSRLVREKGPFGIPKMVMKESTQRIETGARICIGSRSFYQQIKKSLLRSRRNG